MEMVIKDYSNQNLRYIWFNNKEIASLLQSKSEESASCEDGDNGAEFDHQKSNGMNPLGIRHS